MARRHSAKAKPRTSKPRAVDRRESKIKRWNKPSDIPLDEEDQFHTSRDKILLEGDDYEDDDDDGDEEEVFALKGIPDESDDDDEEEEGDDEEVSEAADEEEHVASAKKSKKKGKKGKTADSPPSSADSSDEEEEEGWGTKKSAFYSSNAAQIDSDDEEANELEEQEARRLQAKAREGMTDDDFGLGDFLELAPGPEDTLLDALPPVVQPLPQDKQALLRHLEKTSPEALALARDWEETARKLVKTQAKIASLEPEDTDSGAFGMDHLYYQALTTYATTLAFYLHLRAGEKYAQRPELLRSHPIFPRLLTLKQSLSTLEGLDLEVVSDVPNSEFDSDSDVDSDDLMDDADELWSLDKKKGLELGELEDLLSDARLITSSPDKTAATSKRRPKPPVPEEPPKKKRKTGKTQPDRAPAPVFDLVEPNLAQLKRASTTRPHASASAATDVYGEAESLQAADAADKQARKKTLRFHTARIESTSARRQNARTNAMGGDDDIPYRERRQQREERLAREAAKQRGQGGADLDDVEPEVRSPEKKRRRDDDDDDGDGESGSDGERDGYYELIQRTSKAKKEKKKAEYDAAKAAARPDVVDSADGPRALTRAILKNKGLTPQRSKTVRNPRLKKRQRFEKAKKKMASQKAVYKGGVGNKGVYEGEKSGISKVVKSVRL